MNASAQRQVLADYRRIRAAGGAPADVMALIRDDRANLICHYVAGGRLPPATWVAEWAAARDYCNSMTARPQWWFSPHPPRRPEPRRRPARWRNPVSRQGRSTIPT